MTIILFIINLITTQAHADFYKATIRSEKQCEALIQKNYHTQKRRLYHVQHKITGRGNYAAHYHYEIKYVTNIKNPKSYDNCAERVYCTSYDYKVYVDSKHCEKRNS